ncbi:MAG: histidinol-phosphatase HisJ family protein, partial [Lentisphaerae bacterium]|nr:histidinol-phosphatase HisJ family protein [Lentisphaerota bacterium]
FSVYRAMIASVRRTAKLEVLFGIEADYYPGCLEFQRTWLPSQEFDLVLGSVHYIGDWPFDHPSHQSRWKACNVEAEWRRYFQLVGELADAAIYDVVAHFDLPKKFGARPPDDTILEMAAPALDKVAKAGMGIEINTSGLRKPVREIYPSPGILKLAYQRNIPISFASDAHTPEDVGADFRAAMDLAKNSGYTQYAQYRARAAAFAQIPG